MLEVEVTTVEDHQKRMTVAELRSILDKFPDTMPVALDYDYQIDTPSIAIRWMIQGDKPSEYRDPESAPSGSLKREDVMEVLVFR